MPHPPVVVPSVGRGREAEAASTVQAMRRLAGAVAKWNPDVVAVVSPHSPRRAGALGIWGGERLRGALGRFGAPQAGVDLPRATGLAAALREQSRPGGLLWWEITGGELDHGAVVPLWFLVEAGWGGETVVVGLGTAEGESWGDLGAALRAAGGLWGGRLAVLASGDMSHRLTPGAPGGFDPAGARFDRAFVRLIEEGRYRDIAQMDAGMVEQAGEDVVESTLAAAGACNFASNGRVLLSYEGPFGVGYAVALLHRDDQERNAEEVETRPADLGHWEDAEEAESGDWAAVLLESGRRAVAERLGLKWAGEGAVDRGQAGEPGVRNGGVFVTLWTAEGELRGCVGSLEPACETLVEEVCRSALMAAFEDPRFPPLLAAELEGIRFEVSVLGEMEAVSGLESLDPRRFGLALKAAGDRRSVLLPGIAGLETAAAQLAAVRRKAGVRAGEPVDLFRFSVVKIGEPV